MDVPKKIFQTELMWPVVKALKALGGKAIKSKIHDEVIELEGFGDDVLDIAHGSKNMTEFAYQLGWALTRLKYAGLAENVAHATWALTPEGQKIDESYIDDDLKTATNKKPKN